MLVSPPRRSLRITAPDGTTLAVREWGDPTGRPVLFIHGYSQTGLSWARQVDAPELAHLRLVTFDLPGHGGSDHPPETSRYQDSALWAGDIAAILEQCGLQAVTLVGWSYGGRIIGDYLAAFGTHALAGLVFVDAITENARHFYGSCNRLMKEMGDPDPAVSIAATRAFQRACVLHPLEGELAESLLAAAMMCPPRVRAAMARPADYTAALAGVDIPALVIHGIDDQVIAPAMAVHLAGMLPGARLEMMADTGHAPFLEHPAAFNHLLRDFVKHL
ncbi:alpha/beta fold hydrolase [Aquabacter cavernae]|uniref:alpha/beta fold hydrolase n=1 Tax=Aquabacter cavernae TaxID=2496029 RepID=UPI000F8F7A91|nr:alpha/beta hydrolase [Aquabacter cavernae]